MIELTIPIEPKAQTRPKFGRGGAYEDPKMKAWRRSATLPNTGSESALILSFAGMFILSGIAQIALKREDA